MLVVAGLAACAATGPAVRPEPVVPAPRPTARIRVDLGGPSWARPEQQDRASDAGGRYGLAILAPERSEDTVVAEVGDQQLRKSDVYDRMLENDQRAAQLWVDLLVLDLVVANFAEQFGIRVPDDEVAALEADAESMLRTQVEVEYGGARTFDEYLAAEFGLGLDAYQSLLAIDVARTRYRGLAMRYVAMREDRAEVRLIVHPDAEVLEDARSKVTAGADFAALARQLSEDRTRVQGGRLGPFGRAFRHPIAKVAFELAPGEVSEVLTFEDRGIERRALVYCLRRIDARDEPFAAVRDEIVRDLEARPVTPFEQNAFVAQYCRPTSALDSTSGER